MKVKYSHQWLIHADQDHVWNFFIQCFENSERVPGWPNRLVSLRNLDSEINPRSKEEAIYKIGAFKFKAPYEIFQVIPGSKIVYRPGQGHPLSGKSEISFRVTNAGTVCSWRGEYHSKKALSTLSLIWFKLFFERLFFAEIQRNTKKLQSSRAA